MVKTADIEALVDACLESNLTHIETVSEVHMEMGEGLKAALIHTNHYLLYLHLGGKHPNAAAFKSPLFTEYAAKFKNT